MPSTKSALRRMRIAERNRIYNRAWKTRTKTITKKVMQAVEENDLNSAVRLFDEAQSVIDKAVVKGVIHKNTAARRKAMLAKLIVNLKKTTGAESPSQETV
ncbi:30S ribosomal protein S20 [Acetomicrobium hydrogeniformans]|nr:30S ribosomal protein S20 [Acetomicrobium hydrogeniformans]